MLAGLSQAELSHDVPLLLICQGGPESLGVHKPRQYIHQTNTRTLELLPDGLRGSCPEELGPSVDSQSRVSLSLTVAGDVHYGPTISALHLCEELPDDDEVGHDVEVD